MNYIKDLIDRIQDNADYLSVLWDDVETSETPEGKVDALSMMRVFAKDILEWQIIQLRECLLKEENDIDLQVDVFPKTAYARPKP